METDERPLVVTIVSPDVALLHELSWLLAVVGYDVQTTKTFDKDAVWRRYAKTDVIVLDGRTVAEPYEGALACDTNDPIFRVLLYDSVSPPDFAAWYSAGANDALGVPVSRGELLARLRAGARWLEFERRLQHRSSKSRIPGVYSRRGFVRKLRKLNVANETADSPHTLSLVSIDWYAGICHRCGQAAGRSLAEATARAIRRSAGENAIVAYLEDGCFATLHLGQGLAIVKKLADDLAKEFGSRDSQREASPQPTLTIAISPWYSEDPCEKALDEALETLAIARQSGGDCIVRRSDFADKFASWQSELATGNPFANVVAQDIMEPFPAVLTCDVEQTELVNALRRSGAPVCPYLDAAGRLVGVASADESSLGEASPNPKRLAALPISKPETIAHDANFSEIYEAFSAQNCTTIVVVNGEEALGYLTLDGFLSMIEPVTSGTFAAPIGASDDSRQLIVASQSAEPSSP